MTTAYLTLHETAHPDAPLYFSLDGDTFSMDISAVFRPEEEALAPLSEMNWEQRLEPRLLALAQKMVVPFSGPVHVRDVTFTVVGDVLTLQVWKRTRGLRLAPATILLEDIDDPESAAAFAAQLRESAALADSPARYRGALDYWATWILGALGLASGFISLGWWISRRSRA